MANCQYVDQNKSGLNGWHCARLDKKVDSSLYTNYCNNSINCKYCPYYSPAGDDRFRKAPEPKQSQQTTYNTSASSYQSATATRTQTTSAATKAYVRKGNKIIVALIFGIILFGVLLYVTECSNLQFNFNVPETVNSKDFKIVSLCFDGEEKFALKRKKLDDEDKAILKLQKGLNGIFVEYDDFSYYLGLIEADGKTDYSYNALTYDEFRDAMFKSVIVSVKDKKGNSLNGKALKVTEQITGEMYCLSLGDEGYAIMMKEGVDLPVLTFEIDGYESVTASVEMKQRSVKLDLTMAEEKKK